MQPIRALFTAVAALAFASLATAQRTPDEALQMLQAGNRRFATDRSVPQPIGHGVRHTLARGQSPIAVVVTSSDSRVPPEHLFNAGLGELIVVRTAGHIASSETVAAIEHAVEQLNVPLCVVLAHEDCKVVAAAIEQVDHKRQHGRHSATVVSMLERLEPAVRKAMSRELGGKELHKVAEEEHAQATALECMRRSALLRRYQSVGKFRMVAARYHSQGDVEWLPHRELPPQPEAAHPAPVGSIPMGLPPHVALRMLRSGHSRFLGDSKPMQDLTAARREQLTHDQQPLAIVVTDTDSRVSPEHVFDAGLGELYVVRVSGYTLSDEALASIEFAVSELGASLLVVMGHNRCESIRSVLDEPERQELTPNRRALLQKLEPSVAAAKHGHEGSVADMASKLQTLRTINETRSRSALLRALEQKGRFAMLPTFYDVATGDLHWLKDGHAEDGDHAHAHDDHGSHDHGHEAHDSHSDHDAHATADHDAHGHEMHGDHAHHDKADPHADLPVMDFLPAPIGEMDTAHDHEADDHGHGHDDGHGHDHGHDDDHGEESHGAHDDGHGHDAHGEHGHAEEAHADHGEEEHHEGGMGKMLKNPKILVGGLGLLSLLVAAVMALKSR